MYLYGPIVERTIVYLINLMKLNGKKHLQALVQTKCDFDFRLFTFETWLVSFRPLYAANLKELRATIKMMRV